MEYRLYKGTGFGSNENYKLNTDQCDLYLRTLPADSFITITDNKPFNSGAFRTGQAEILIKQSDILGIDSFLNLACFDYLRVLLPTVTTNPPTRAYFYYFVDNVDLIAVKGGEIGDYILKLTIRLDYFNTYKLDKLLLNMDVEESQFLVGLNVNEKRNSFLHSPLPPYNNITLSFMGTVSGAAQQFQFALLLQTNLVGPVLVITGVKDGQATATGDQILTDGAIYEQILLLAQASKLRIGKVSGELNVTPIKMWLIPYGVFSGLGGGAGSIGVYGKTISCTLIEDTYNYIGPINANSYRDPTFDNAVTLASRTHYGYGTRTHYLLPPNEIYFGSNGWRASVQYTLSPTGFEVLVNAFGQKIDVTDDYEFSISKSSDTDFWNIDAIGTGIKLIASAGQLAAGAATGNVIGAGIGAVNLAGNVAGIISGSPAQAVTIGNSGVFMALKVCNNVVGAISLGTFPRTNKELKQYGIKFSTPYHMETNCELANLHVLYPNLDGNSNKDVWYIKARSVSVAQRDKTAAGTERFKSVPTEAIRYLKERLAEGLHYFRDYINFKMKNLEA